MQVALPFSDRTEAGRLLARRLAQEKLQPPLAVVALPRGGVPVAAEVARRLHAPLDLLLVRKIGAPYQRELAVAAVVDGDQPELVIDEAMCAATGADQGYIDRQAGIESREINRRRALYMQGRAPLDLSHATTVLVDDGIATGTTVRAALKALRRRRTAGVVLAVPVAAHETLMSLRLLCDRIVCLAEPQPLRAISEHYVDFHQVDDDEVLAVLASVNTGGTDAPCDGDERGTG